MTPSLRKRAFHIFLAEDRRMYVWLTLGAGSPNETLSGAAWRTEQAGKPLGRFFRPIIDWCARVFFDQQDHCKSAHEVEAARAAWDQKARL